MKMDDEKSLKLVFTAIGNCSEETVDEIARELEKL